MSNIRLIARLDIKGPHLIKGIHLEGLRKVGDPHEFAMKYYEDGADELLYVDAVASLYGRNNLMNIINRAAENVFVPITVGGGIRSIQDVREILRNGADKVAINTAAIRKPELISEVADKFGSQCMVLSIEAKKKSKDKWEAYTDNGREKTAQDVVEWAVKGVEFGAGEILLTSVDMEGTEKGFDLDLISAVTKEVNVPVIASGGMGTMKHLSEVVNKTSVNAIAMASILHWNKASLKRTHEQAREIGIPVRQVWQKK